MQSFPLLTWAGMQSTNQTISAIPAPLTVKRLLIVVTCVCVLTAQ